MVTAMQPVRVRKEAKWCIPRPGHKVIITIIIFTWCFNLTFGKLVFTAEPKTQAVVFGGGFMLNCSAKETLNTNQAITYKWLINGTDLKAKFTDASFFKNNSVYMTQITKAHVGNYKCTATVIDGSSTKSASSKTAAIVLAYIDAFVIHPTSVSTNDTSNAIFTCVTGKSAPPPSVYWERNGAVFPGGIATKAVFGTTGADTSGQLSMRLEVPTDRVFDGKFACVATNPLSKETKKSNAADLKVDVVLKPPKIVVQPPTKLIKPANFPLELRCVISGVPKPTTTWYQENGTNIINSSRIIVAGNGSLIFRPLLEKDAESYTCQGKNSQGSVTAETTDLMVAVLSMEFQKHPSDKSAISGQTITLHCNAPYSVPPANITWYKNNEIFRPRSGEYAATILKTGDLYFSNIQMNDQGVYFCVAVNNFAEPRTRASSTAAVVVTGAPQMLTPPIPTTVIKEGLLRMTCLVKGDPFPTVTWWKDEKMLVASDKVSFRNLNQELWIGKMTKPDSGLYYCKAGNKYGSIKSQPVLVDIVVPPQILQSVESQRVPTGASVQLKCIIFADPTPVIVWLKDGFPLTQSAFVKVATDQVSFPSIRAVDAGTYTCRATNKGGVKESVGTITVLVKPSFVISPSNVTVNSGAPVEMSCVGAGVPTPTITWFYNNTKTFPPSVTFSSDKKAMRIEKTRLDHIGLYKCILQNEMGVAAKEGKLVVQVAPTIHNITGPSVVSQTRDLALTCVAYGIPFPKITWFLNSRQLKETTDKRVTSRKRDTILIRFITTADAGDYKCIAENSQGKVESQMRVYVRDPPYPPMLQIPKPLSVNSMNLSWIPVKQEANNNVSFWVIQYRLSIAPDFLIYRDDIPVSWRAFEVSGLTAATSYHFRMAARNEVGIGQYTGVLSAKTFETAPTAPRMVKVTLKKSRNVTLSWEKPSNLRASDVTDYEIHYRRMDRVEGFVTVHVIPVLPTQTHTVMNLNPDRPYAFKVRAAARENDVRLWGTFSETVTANTTMALPSLSPQDVNTKVLSNTSVQLSWKPIPEESQNGRISLYRIRYKQTNFPTNQEQTVAANATDVIISGLLPWRFYTFTVAGMNPIGHSPYSAAVVARTLPGLPTGAPTEIQLLAMSSTNLTVSWKAVEADKQNSAIFGYILHYRNTLANQTSKLTVNSTDKLSANISGLEPWTEYSVQIQAFTNQIENGNGPLSKEIKLKTKPDIPGKVRNVKVVPDSYSAMVIWDAPLKPNGKIENYTVTYLLVGRVQVAESSTWSLTGDETSAGAGTEGSEASSEALTSNNAKGKGTEASETTEMVTVDVSNTVSQSQVSKDSAASSVPSVTDSSNDSTSTGSTEDNGPTTDDNSRQKRAIDPPTNTNMTKGPPPTWTINSTAPHVTLNKLEPNSIYNVSVVAATSAGQGKEPVNATFTTSPPPTTQVEETSTVPMTISEVPTGIVPTLSTTTKHAPDFLPFGIRQEHLAYFIGGCVAVATIIIILIVVIVLCCVRRKRQKESPRKFFVPPPASSTLDKAPSLTDVSEPPSTRKLKGSKAAKSQASKSSNVSFNPNPEIHTSVHVHEDTSSCHSSHSGGVRPRHPVSGFSTPSCDQSHSGTSLSGFNLIQDLSSVEGIDNPGYRQHQVDSDSDNTKISNIPLAPSRQQCPTGRRPDVLSKRLTHEMKRRSAQIIAMQRERQSTLNNPDEIDLLANESVIVYDERTAL